MEYNDTNSLLCTHIVQPIRIIETPRDAMQGISSWIPTPMKIEYINSLLKVGFHSLDFGSFVSSEAIPQMSDTKEVIAGIDKEGSNTKMIAIVPNLKGAEHAVKHDIIDYLGYPFSISETFQLRNTKVGVLDSVDRVKSIQELCQRNNKSLIIYISMGFGNPYGDHYDIDLVLEWVERMHALDIEILSLSDTVGIADKDLIAKVFAKVIPQFPKLEIGAHLHTEYDMAFEKIEAAYLNGCTRFDGAIKGFGGCPMAKDDLIGNMPTEKLIEYFGIDKLESGFNHDFFIQSMALASKVFPH